MINQFLQRLYFVCCCFLWLVALIGTTQGRSLAQSNIPACRDTATVLYESAGNISSPNYPSNYPDNAHCKWSIRAPSNQSIEIHFETFFLELSKSCQYDFVKLFDGDEQYTAARYCGKITPSPFISNSSEVSIVFESDESLNRSGFLLRWNFRDRCLGQEFTCWDQSCIPINQHCDHLKNCPDNSDEVECAQSSENMNVCGKQEIAPQFTWNPRILGGNEAIPGSWPWQAELISTLTLKSYCGASIIHPMGILTAAHCVDFLSNSSQVNVMVGRHHTRGTRGQQLIEVSRIFRHSQYNKNTFFHDLALLQLKTSISFTKTIRPICRPPKDNTEFMPQDGTVCIATGFGDTDPTDEGVVTSHVLRQVRLPITDVKECKDQYARSNAPVDVASQLCAGTGSGDACQGDSGGPLMCLFGENTWYQVGITSFGIECDDPLYPGVYQKVSFHEDWIDKRLQWIEACTTSVTLSDGGGYFDSPNYPDGYDANLRCEWRLVASSGQKIQVKYINLKLHRACSSTSGDLLEIYDGNSLRYRFCGSTVPVDFTSTYENVTVVFKTDHSGTSSGFSIRWNAFTEERNDFLAVSTIDIFSETETTTQSSYAHHTLTTYWLNCILQFAICIFFL